MKQNYFFFLLFCSQFFFSQIINFPDANFKARLLQSSTSNQIAGGKKIDLNNDGEIDVNEAKNIISISINEHLFFPYQNSYNPGSSFNISSLEGINYFINLKRLDCKNNNLTTIDFKNLVNLEQIYCQKNKITQFLNFEDVNKLYVFNCSENLLTSLDFSKAAKNVESNSSDYNNKGHVMYKYDNNPLTQLNIQTGFKAIWRLLINDWNDCPFGLPVINNCFNFPEHIPTLVNVKINCIDAGEGAFANSVNITDNCLIATSETTMTKLTISPNPTKDFLKLDVTERIDKIDIFDLSGRLILSPQLSQNKVNISKLQSGVYYLRLLINGKYLNTKFVKQ